jgi:hypothetical protein
MRVKAGNAGYSNITKLPLTQHAKDASLVMDRIWVIREDLNFRGLFHQVGGAILKKIHTA